MRRAQITIFIILGIVIVIVIVFLIMALKAYQPERPSVEIESDVTLAKTCLTRTTQNAIYALQNDGVITFSESGPLEDKEHFYLLYDEVQYSGFVFGVNNYIGLCDNDGLNGIGQIDGELFTCEKEVYHQLDSYSVQEMLEASISSQMQSCINQSGQSEVIMQSDGLLVRWPSLEISHSERAPLQPVWSAIEEIVTREVSDTHFTPFVDEGDGKLGCTNCEIVDVKEVDPAGKGVARQYDIWEFSVAGNQIARIFLQNRGLLDPDDQPVRCIDSTSTEDERKITIFSFDEDELNPPRILASNRAVKENVLELTPDATFSEWTLEIKPNEETGEFQSELLDQVELTTKNLLDKISFTIRIVGDGGACP